MKRSIFVLAALLLTQSAYAEPCRALWKEGADSVLDCGGVHLVRLRGAPALRAKKMGSLVKRGVLSEEVLRYFTQKVAQVAHQEGGWLGTPLILAYHQLVRLFHLSTPSGLAEEIDSLSESLGMDPIEVKRGLSLPDTGVFLQGLGSYPGFGFLPATGCTSVGASLAGGGFAYGRNLDFAGVGIWDHHPMLYVAEPEEGSPELKHVIIGADGLPFGGITGVNEAGLTFAVHQNYSRDISVRGVPMVLIGELVLRQARTLDEAVEILRRNRPAILWTFVLTDLRKGERVAVESSSRFFLVRKESGAVFSQTNHALHPETRAWENASTGILANSQLRYQQALRMLTASPPRGAADLAKVLAYQGSDRGELNAHADILKAETIQTVLFEAAPNGEITLSLSADDAPASSGRFAAFPLASLLSGELKEWQPRDYLGTPAEVRHRQRTFASAYRLYFDEGKRAEAASLLASQRTIGAALFRAVAMAELGRFEDSLRLSEEALRDPRFTGEAAHIRDSLERVRLVALLRLNRADEARPMAHAMLERGKKGPTAEIARRILNRERVPGRILDLRFDFFSGDLSGRND